MEKQSLKQLLKKRQEDTITKDELSLLETWYNQYAQNAMPYDNTENYLKDMQEMDTAFPFDNEIKIKKIQLWPRIAVAAAVATAIVFGIYFFNFRNNELLKQVQDNIVVNDIAPGNQAATLTLANGDKIRLADVTNGMVAKQAGATVVKSAKGQLIYTDLSSNANSKDLNTLSTAKGETYQVRLPDGTKVWLNAASSITYSTALNELGMRSIKLEGEAYFEVYKDKKRPFIVESRGQEVEVLGTHFNVSAYRNESSSKTTLLEGTVRVSGRDGEGSVILKPNQQALNIGTAINVATVDIKEVVAWKNETFNFNDKNITEIMTVLERWYNIEVKYDGKPSSEVFYGEISRNKNISQVLKMLEQTNAIHFKTEGRRVTVRN